MTTTETTLETAKAATADTTSTIRQKTHRDIASALGTGPATGLGLLDEITEDDPDHQTPKSADRVRAHHATETEAETETETEIGRGKGKGIEIETEETETRTKTAIRPETETGKGKETAAGTAHQKDTLPGKKHDS